MSSSIPSEVGVPQHPDEHRSEDPVLLAVDQELGEGAALRVGPEPADPVGSLEVRKREDVEKFGAGAGPRASRHSRSWRPNAKWMANLSIINGWLLPLGGRLELPAWSATRPHPPTVLGWPMYENGSMDGTLTGSAADYTVVSGDFSQYCIVDRVGTSIEVVQNVFGTNHRTTGQRGFYMHFRVGADCPIPDAFRLTNHSA
jgi:hypothetical protein